jgi:hypothetical protein
MLGEIKGTSAVDVRLVLALQPKEQLVKIGMGFDHDLFIRDVIETMTRPLSS